MQKPAVALAPFNMLRNPGGSIGIALTTRLETDGTCHRSLLETDTKVQ